MPITSRSVCNTNSDKHFFDVKKPGLPGFFVFDAVPFAVNPNAVSRVVDYRAMKGP